MERAEKVFKDLCDLTQSLKLSERFQNKGFQESWSVKNRKVREDIEMLTAAEYSYLESKYQKWLSELNKLGQSDEGSDSI